MILQEKNAFRNLKNSHSVTRKKKYLKNRRIAHIFLIFLSSSDLQQNINEYKENVK